MKTKLLAALAAAALIAFAVLPVSAAKKPKSDDGMNMFDKSDFIEKEQPELPAETKKLISLYKRKPTEENYLNLRAEVIRNYDAVLDRKEAKLAALKKETAGKPGGLAKAPRWRRSCRRCTRPTGIASTAACSASPTSGC